MSFPPTTPPGLPNTLGDIVTKIRRITKSPSQNNITDAQIVQYVNTYMLYDFPEELRLKDLFTNYKFTTEANQATYALPTDIYTEVEPPLYINGYQSYFTQSQDNFYMLYPMLGLQNQPVFGNGTVGPYVFQLSNFPILQSEIVVSATSVAGDAMVATDFPVNTATGFLTGTFVNGAISTVNYLLGLFSITFTLGVQVGTPLNVQFVPYNPSRPVAALFYNNTFTLRPVPDTSYLVQIAAYITPTQMLLTNQTPQIKQWWQLIALGAAIKIFEDRGDMEQISIYMPTYQQQKLLAQRRTLVQMASERTATIYTEQVQYPIGNFFNQF